MRWLVLLFLVATSAAGAAQGDWVAKNKPQLIREYLELLAIPNGVSARANTGRNAAHISAMMERRGLSPRLLESEDAKVPPLIYGEWRVPGAKRTLILYAHYDGQPVTAEEWKVTQPFAPLLLSERHDKGGNPLPVPAAGQPVPGDWRLYGRSASDDKAGVMAILAAVDALKAEKRTPSFNLKIVFEGEEEAGSPNLGRLLRRHKATLGSD